MAADRYIDEDDVVELALAVAAGRLSHDSAHLEINARSYRPGERRADAPVESTGDPVLDEVADRW